MCCLDLKTPEGIQIWHEWLYLRYATTLTRPIFKKKKKKKNEDRTQ